MEMTGMISSSLSISWTTTSAHMTLKSELT